MVASVESRIFYLASLVLGDSVLGVLLATLALAVGPPRLGNVDLKVSCVSELNDLDAKTGISADSIQM